MSLSKLAVDPARLAERDASAYRATVTKHKIRKFEAVTLQTLTKHLNELELYIDVDVLVPYLYAELLLTGSELDLVSNRRRWLHRPIERLLQVLTCVRTKGPQAARKFSECVWKSYTDTGHEGHKYVGELVSDSDPALQCEQDHNAGLANERVRKMKEKFARLIVNVLQKLLQIATIDLNQFRVYVTLIPASEKNPEDMITEDDKHRIQQADSIEKIFGLLGNYWNYENIDLLVSIVKTYGDEDTLEMVKRYQEELRKFESDPDHVPVESPPMALKSSRNAELSQKFADLIINLFKIFGQMQIDLEKLRMYASLVPLGYRHFNQAHLDELAQAPSLAAMFVIFGCYWDWRNYHLLTCIVDKFGSPEMKEMVAKYHVEVMKLRSSSSSSDCWLYQMETKILVFKTRYAALVLEVLLILEKSTTLTIFHSYLATLPACLQHPSIKMFSHNIAETQSWGATFLQLNPCWDYLNFRLLQHIIEKFGIQQLHESLQAYCGDVSDFVRETKVCELVRVLPSGYPHAPAKSNLVKVTFTITGSWKERTMEDFERLRQAFIHSFCLPDYVLIISGAKVHTADTIASSYCKLRCYIPSSIACLMIHKSQENNDFYQQHDISRIKFHAEGQYYFEFLTSENPENVLKRTEKHSVLTREMKEVLASISSARPEVEYQHSNDTPSSSDDEDLDSVHGIRRLAHKMCRCTIL